jgi:hypothetical protein
MTRLNFRFLRPAALVALWAGACGFVLLAQTAPSSSPANASFDLTPLTFHFKEANSSFVNSGLAEQLHLPVTVAANTPLSARGRAGTTPILITADAEQLPFWDAITLLQKGNNLSVRINDRPIPQVRDCIRQGPFVAQLNSIGVESTVFPQDEGELNPGAGDMKNPVLRIFYFVAADPRLKVVLRNPGLSSVSDDDGHTLALPTTKLQVPPILDDSSSSWVRFPANFGKSLTLKGRAEFTIQLTEARLVIPDIQKQATEVVLNAGKSSVAVAISDFKSEPLGFTLSAGTVGTTPFPAVVVFSVLDATDTLLITRTLTAAGSMSISLPAEGRGAQGRGVRSAHIPTPPFRLTVAAPDQTQTVQFPYEFKRVTLPD